MSKYLFRTRPYYYDGLKSYWVIDKQLNKLMFRVYPYRDMYDIELRFANYSVTIRKIVEYCFD